MVTITDGIRDSSGGGRWSGSDWLPGSYINKILLQLINSSHSRAELVFFFIWTDVNFFELDHIYLNHCLLKETNLKAICTSVDPQLLLLLIKAWCSETSEQCSALSLSTSLFSSDHALRTRYQHLANIRLSTSRLEITNMREHNPQLQRKRMSTSDIPDIRKHWYTPTIIWLS